MAWTAVDEQILQDLETQIQLLGSTGFVESWSHDGTSVATTDYDKLCNRRDKLLKRKARATGERSDFVLARFRPR